MTIAELLYWHSEALVFQDEHAERVKKAEAARGY